MAGVRSVGSLATEIVWHCGQRSVGSLPSNLTKLNPPGGGALRVAGDTNDAPRRRTPGTAAATGPWVGSHFGEPDVPPCTNDVRTAGSACSPAGQACTAGTPVRPGSR
ncbi:hypothetical protein PCASD_06312 [Puccinia coronata f. sp. avenae]|uniref:Uncharacterized protein n=1 Tax=Puccinia coronata f. sp. avenae TaxID=200324 RepID=A0A2N5V923_9BASI|nr:hypothetical protein PCASD_06312 [Puccinia coronata f. sp. avenae]